MATAEQIKSLIRSHLNDQPEQFFIIALQVAAHEAKQTACRREGCLPWLK